jgi:hypothetical protein
MQPTMRYKPRTDLERIFDANKDKNLDKSILNQQLKTLDLNVTKNLDEQESTIIKEEDVDFDDIDFDFDKKVLSTNNLKTTKFTNKKKRINNNINAKKLMKAYRVKTHY